MKKDPKSSYPNPRIEAMGVRAREVSARLVEEVRAGTLAGKAVPAGDAAPRLEQRTGRTGR